MERTRHRADIDPIPIKSLGKFIDVICPMRVINTHNTHVGSFTPYSLFTTVMHTAGQPCLRPVGEGPGPAGSTATNVAHYIF